MILNVGCGDDEWGDVRLDVERNGQINVIGDAQNLPFRDSVFSEVRFFHVIEHLRDWEKGLSECMRVSKKFLDIKFPVDDGFKRPLTFAFFNLDLNALREIVKCRKLGWHNWILDSKTVCNVLRNNGFEATTVVRKHPLLKYGRKSKLNFFKKYLRYTVECSITAQREKPYGRLTAF